MGKPVKEEMSVSAVAPLVDSGADAGPYCSDVDQDSTAQRTWMIVTLRTETDSHQSPRLVPWAELGVMPPWYHGQLQLVHKKNDERLQPDGNPRFVLTVEHALALVAPAAASSVDLGCLFVMLVLCTDDKEAYGNSPSVMPRRLEIEGSDGLIVSSPGGDGGD